MEQDKGAAAVATTPESLSISGAKLLLINEQNKDILKILAYFRYTIGTTLDAAMATGVLRNSITWYVKFLEQVHLLRAVFRRPDRKTGRMAKWYTADVTKWGNEPILLSEVSKMSTIDPKSGEVNILAVLSKRKGTT